MAGQVLCRQSQTAVKQNMKGKWLYENYSLFAKTGKHYYIYYYNTKSTYITSNITIVQNLQI